MFLQGQHNFTENQVLTSRKQRSNKVPSKNMWKHDKEWNENTESNAVYSK